METHESGQRRRIRTEAVAALLMSVGLGMAAVALRSEVAQAQGPSRGHLTPCHLSRLSEEVQCGVIEVFENREAKSGRRLGIQFAVLAPLRRAKEPDPLFIMAGGPGQGARSFGAIAARYFKKVRRTREIVLVDLRGTGDSGPLECPAGDDALLAFAPDQEKMVKDCLAALEADPRHYTHKEALADLDEIRRALGYERINLWGGSWGTRAALLYAATYPGAVRTVILDGAVPLDMEFPKSAAEDSQRALDLLFDQCAKEEDCARAFPHPRADLVRLLESLKSRPARVHLRHPQTGQPIEATLTLDFLAEAIRGALYTPGDASRLLQLLAHAASGDFAPLLAQVVRTASTSTDSMALGVTLSVLCSEDLPQVMDADFEALGRGTFDRSTYADIWRTRCRVWPAGPGIEVDRQVRMSAPALILSGIHDPVTPPRWGEQMGQHFPRHLHVVVPGAAHNASFSGCVPDLMAAFIEKGGVEGIDASCAQEVPWPPFAISDAGSRS